MSKVMSLKMMIRNIANEKNIPAQVILQNYMFERLLIRLSVSEYKENFVIKGSILIAAIVGLNNRTTMGIDSTLRNLPMTSEAIRNALEQICAVPIEDNVTFEIGTIAPIREDSVYKGYHISLSAKFDTMTTPLSFNVFSDDTIIPYTMQYKFTEIFDDQKSYELWTYNVETVMAEKVESILWRGVFNTRPRDFYDVFILATTQNFDKTIFTKALTATATRRGTAKQIADVSGILHNIEESPELRIMWNKYRKQFAYAQNITYEQIMGAVRNLVEQPSRRTSLKFQE